MPQGNMSNASNLKISWSPSGSRKSPYLLNPVSHNPVKNETRCFLVALLNKVIEYACVRLSFVSNDLGPSRHL